MNCEDCDDHSCLTCNFEQIDYFKSPCKECVDTYKIGELPNWEEKLK